MDPISYAYADKQAQRIKKINANPDSTSGVVTVPKVIASGETITIPAGRVAVLPNVQVDGVINIEGEVFVPSGSSYTGTDIESNNAVFDTLKVQGQNVSPFSGFKNYIINGNFDIWQRGVSQTISGYGSVDRWNFINAGTSSRTISKVIATDTDRPYFNSPNILGITLTSLDATTSPRAIRHSQAIEDVTQLAGKTITLSFWARATNNTNIETTIQQVFGAGGSPSSAVIIGAKRFSLTPQWTKFTTTVNVPSIVGKTLGTDGIHTSTTNVKFHLMSDSVNASNEGLTGTLTPTAGTIVFFAQVQLEEGSVATPFENRPYGLELSLCQRYLPSSTGFYSGHAATTNEVYLSVPTMVVPRVTPTGITYSAGGAVYYTNTSSLITAISLFAGNANGHHTLKVNPTGSPLTIGQGVMVGLPPLFFTGCEL